MPAPANEQPPVLLITAFPAWRTVRTLSRRLNVLVLDCGAEALNGAHPAAIARRALALLDSAGIERAHVYGIGVGGAAAHELAGTQPGRVSRVVLAASPAVGRRRVPPDKQTREFLARVAQMPMEEAAWASIPYLYGEATRTRYGGRIGEDIARSLRPQTAPVSYRARLASTTALDATLGRHRIAAPTLIVQGTADRIVPAANAQQLADAIPNARLHLVEGAGHLYMTDEPGADREIVRFLLEEPLSAPRAGPPARRRRPPHAAPAAHA